MERRERSRSRRARFEHAEHAARCQHAAHLGECCAARTQVAHAEADLASEEFTLVRTRGFLLGATRLWVARAPGASADTVQDARSGAAGRGTLPSGDPGVPGEGAGWSRVQLLVSGILTVAMAAGLIQFARTAKNLPLAGPTRFLLGALLVLGVLVFALRTLLLGLRGGAPRSRKQ